MAKYAAGAIVVLSSTHGKAKLKEIMLCDLAANGGHNECLNDCSVVQCILTVKSVQKFSY